MIRIGHQLRSAIARFDQGALLKGSAIVFAIQVLGQVFGYITQIILARTMGAEELGYYVYAVNMAMLLSALSMFGYQSGAIRFVIKGDAQNDPAYVRAYVRLGIVVALIGSSLLAGIGVAVWLFSDRGGDTAFEHIAFPIALCAVPLISVMVHFGTIGRTLKLFVISFLPIALRPLGILAAALGLLWIGRDLSALSMVYAFCGVMVSLAVWQIVTVSRHVENRFPSQERSYNDARLWVTTGFQLLILGMAESQLARINVAMTGAFLPATDTAILNIAFVYVSPISVGLFALNTAMGPNASRLYADGKLDELQRLLRQLSHLRFWPTLLALAVLALAGRWLLAIMGPQFVAGYHTLLLLALSRLIVAASGPLTWMVTFMGLQLSAMYIFIAAIAILVVLNLVLMPIYGLVGAGLAVVGMTLFWNIGLHVLISRRSGLVPSIFSWRGR